MPGERYKIIGEIIIFNLNFMFSKIEAKIETHLEQMNEFQQK